MTQATCVEKVQEFSCLVPFSGFYDSTHDQLIDDAEEALFSGDSGEIDHPSLYETFWINLDHKAVCEKYARDYVSLVSSTLGIKLTFEEMVSPREYNFSTDRIFAKIDRETFLSLFESVKGERLDEVVREMFTSGPGFISYYQNNVSEWGDVDSWDHNQCGAVLETAWRRKIKDDEIDLDDLFHEHFRDSLENWLVDSADHRALRALRVNDYLRQRAERHYFVLA